MRTFFLDRHFSLASKRWIYFSNEAPVEAGSAETPSPVEVGNEVVSSVDSPEKVEAKLNAANQQLEEFTREFEDPNGPYKGLSPEARDKFGAQLKVKIEALKTEQADREKELAQKEEQATQAIVEELKAALDKAQAGEGTDEKTATEPDKNLSVEAASATTEETPSPVSPEQVAQPIIEKITDQKNWVSKIVKEHVSSGKGDQGEALRKNLAERYGLKPYPGVKEDPSGQRFVEKLFTLSTDEMREFNAMAQKVKMGDTITLNPDGTVGIEFVSAAASSDAEKSTDPTSTLDVSSSETTGTEAALSTASGEVADPASDEDPQSAEGTSPSSSEKGDKSDLDEANDSDETETAAPEEENAQTEAVTDAAEGANEKAVEALKQRIQEAFPEAEVVSCEIKNVIPDDISGVDVHTEIVLVVRGDTFRVSGQGTDTLVPNAREASTEAAFNGVSDQYKAKLERDRAGDEKSLAAYPLFADRFKDQMKEAHHIKISHVEQVDGDQFRTTLHLEMTVRGKLIKLDKPGPPAPTREQALQSASMMLFKDLPKAYDEAQQNPQSTIPSEIPEKEAFNRDQFFKDSIKETGNGGVEFNFYNPNKKEAYKGKLANGTLTLVDKRGFVLSLPLRYKQAPGGRASVFDQGGYQVSEQPPKTGNGEYPIPEGDHWIDVRSGTIGMTPDGLQKMVSAVMDSLEGGPKLPLQYPISNNKKGVSTNGKLPGSGMLQLG